MDERRQQLLAAAEAARIWVHAQRATWSDDYPRALAERRPASVPEMPSLTLVPSAVAASLEPAAAFEPMLPTAPSIGPRDRVDALLQWVRAAASGFGPLIRHSWWKAAVAAVLIVAATVVRTHWSDVSATVTTNLAAGRRAVETGSRTLIDAGKAAQKSASANSAAPVPANPNAGQLQVETNPPGARVLIDGKDRGATPVTIQDLAVGPHSLVLRAAEGTLQRTISIAAGQTTAINEAIFSGWLHVSSPLELKVSEGSSGIRLDDRNQVLLQPGSHDMVFENAALGFRTTRRVEIKPGDTTSITVEPRPSKLSVAANEPAVVTVDGERVGDTPLVDHPIKIGTRDITVTNAAGDIRRQTITVTVQPTQLEIDFSRP